MSINAAKHLVSATAERYPALWRLYMPLRRRYWHWSGDQREHEWDERREFFRYAACALDYNGISGDYLEFGCFGAMTFSLAYHAFRRHREPRRLWAFDSFAGLPSGSSDKDDHPGWVHGTMSMGEQAFHRACRNNGVPRTAYGVIPGFYADTLTDPTTDRTVPQNIALAYIDCDLYSSTRDVLTFLQGRIKHGMILAFDDYFCWSKTHPSGERLAVTEHFERDDRFSLLAYRPFGWHGMSFVVEQH